MSVMIRLIAGAAALAVMATFAGPARAQLMRAQRAQAQAHAWCENKERAPIDTQIKGCTSLIESGKERNDTLAAAFSNRGNGYRFKGDTDRAIQDYDQAVKLDPKNAIWFINRGAAYDFKGQHDRAIEDYDQAIKLNPKQIVAFLNRGIAYNSKGEHDRAIQDYDEAIRLSPERKAIHVLNRGNAYRLKGDIDRALRDLNEAVALNPRSANAFYFRSLVREKKGDTAGAESDLAEARRINPNVGR